MVYKYDRLNSQEVLKTLLIFIRANEVDGQLIFSRPTNTFVPINIISFGYLFSILGPQSC